MAWTKKMKCWEIIECKDTENCRARLFPDVPCWEIDQLNSGNRGYHDVCRECKVFIINEESMMSENRTNEFYEYQAIMNFVKKCPVYENTLQHEGDIPLLKK